MREGGYCGRGALGCDDVEENGECVFQNFDVFVHFQDIDKVFDVRSKFLLVFAHQSEERI